MIKTLSRFFGIKKAAKTSDYEGFADFFLRASSEEKERVIREAARKANNDQFKVFTEARLKAKAN